MSSLQATNEESQLAHKLQPSRRQQRIRQHDVPVWLDDVWINVEMPKKDAEVAKVLIKER